MKIVHLADLHLGYRAYHRTAGKGVNLREADVARAFKEAIDKAIEIEPAVTVVAGDIFHTVRPPNSIITFAFKEFARLAECCPVIMVAGNHETPRSRETGNILELFHSITGANPVQVYYNEPRWCQVENGISILCASHNAIMMRPKLEPDPQAKYNVLLIHAAWTGYRPQVRRGGDFLRADEIKADKWDYVALGDYHTYHVLAPNMIYPGAIERTSSNIWAEADEDKGFVAYDLSGDHSFVALESPRAVVSLGPFDGEGMSAAEIDDVIEATVIEVEGGIKDKIVRFQMTNVPAAVNREIDHKKVRDYRNEAVHFHLDIRRPTVLKSEDSAAAASRRLTLDEELEIFLRERWRPESETNRDALVALAQKYMAEAAEDEDRFEEG